jgi:branched-chain amino acid transport system ATP-binding protein
MSTDTTPEATDTTEASTDSAVLETDALTKEFGRLVAVDSVSLEIERGEFRSIIGPNGAGKTTLFNCITGALTPTSGRVHFDGQDVTGLTPHERVRRGIGRSFQITNVFSGLTVRENVRLAAQSVQEETVAPMDQLFRDADDFPDTNDRTNAVLEQIGLDGRGEERAATLAYGDRRRLEIGLVLATDPELVLLDEPTAGMSGEETDSTMALIDDVLADRTIVLIEHDVDLVMDVSDRVTVLNRGAELITDTPAAVAENDDVQDAYLGGETL